ncbi:TPA: glycosyltransferase [Vibrio vulnificus]|nr:glycosyltransferase [Vibrio vulnificus]
MSVEQKKTIVINALSALRGGGQTYIINLLKELDNIGFDRNVILLVNKKNKKIFLPFISKNVSFYDCNFASYNIFFRVIWEIFYLPYLLLIFEATSYYAPGGIMITKTATACKSYTALRNMLPFDERERKRFPLLSYVRFKLWILKRVFLISYKLSDGVIFISKYSRDEVKKYIPDIESKSKVIYHGINDDFLKKKHSASSSQLPAEITTGNYYLYVSILDVYKAQLEVVQEWLEMTKSGFRYPLILVGPNYNEYGNKVVKIINDNGSGLVKYIGQVEYSELPLLYNNSRALIFASSCECCPNILLEKLASGRPVISSNVMPMPEFGLESVIYFDPYSKGSLTKAVQYLESGNKMEKYSVLSELRSQDFSWNITTKNTFSFLLGLD